MRMTERELQELREIVVYSAWNVVFDKAIVCKLMNDVVRLRKVLNDIYELETRCDHSSLLNTIIAINDIAREALEEDHK